MDSSSGLALCSHAMKRRDFLANAAVGAAALALPRIGFTDDSDFSPIWAQIQKQHDEAVQRFHTDLNSIKNKLQSHYFEHLYSNTYYSLLDRMDKDGFLPESMTGAYEGMYCRTTGALVSLLIETGRLKEAELNLQCVLNATSIFPLCATASFTAVTRVQIPSGTPTIQRTYEDVGCFAQAQKGTNSAHVRLP
jgi:hypothetical protein